jgi:NAD(P)H-hydrate epimerase
VTFGNPKVGLLRFPGASAVGELVVADIGIPADLLDTTAPVMLTSPAVASSLPSRPLDAHKGTFGKALVVAGSVNYTGAAALAAMGASRVGAGLVTLAIPRPIHPAVASQVAECTYLVLPHDLGVVIPSALPVLENKLADYDAVLVGPGLGSEKQTGEFVRALVGGDAASGRGRIGFVARKPEASPKQPRLASLVVDADGLNHLAATPKWWTLLPEGTILTPHPGEMARLIGDSATPTDVQADRTGIASQMAKAWHCTVVLKGAFTIIAAPDGRLAINPFANSGLATAGTGDVLAGAIVGLCAQGMTSYEAATAGVYLHSLAGELATREIGPMGTVAGDLPPRLPPAIHLTRLAGGAGKSPGPRFLT